MKSNYLLLALASFTLASDPPAARLRHRRAASSKLKLPPQSTSNILPDTYIVEFASGGVGSLAKRSENTRTAFFATLQRSNLTYSIEQELDMAPEIFDGATVRIANLADMNALGNSAAIKAIWPVVKSKIPIPDIATKRAKRALVDADVYPPHQQIGAAKLHAQGITGKGQLVAIIDSGVDYTHPSLGGCLGPKCKVKHGYDFVGDTYGDGSFQPNTNPYSQCLGFIHGTAVAGLVAALPSDNGFSGVAPAASLSSYRVADCSGNTDTTLIIQALLRSYADGAKIVQLAATSIGAWPEDAIATVVDRLGAKGVVVAATTGDTPQGPFYANDPSTANSVLSVGSVESSRYVQFVAQDQSGRKLPFYGSHSFGSGRYATYVTSNDTSVEDDACNGLPADTPDLTNRVAIVRRGGCFFDQKAATVAKYNATGILIYSTPGAAPSYDDGIYYGFNSGNIGLLSERDGLYLVARFRSGRATFLTFPPHLTSTPNRDTFGVSAFSEYGPTYSLTPTPKLVAPGSNILSLAPVNLGLYTVLTGTSFSAPLVAGSVALYASKVLKAGSPKFVRQVTEALTSNATPVKQKSRAASVAQQGAGVLNVYSAITSSTLVSPSFLLLNDTRHCKGRQTFTLRNTSPKTVTYHFKHNPSVSLLTHNKNSIYPLVTPGTSSRAASARFSRGMITLKKGQSASIYISFKAPTLTASTFPLYSGFIGITTSQKESFSIPYMGMAASMYDLPVLDSGAEVAGATLPLVADANMNIQTGERTYTLAGDDYPVLHLRFTAGTRLGLIEVVNAETTYIPTIPSTKSLRSRPPQSPAQGLVGPFASISTTPRNGVSAPLAVGSVQTYSLPWQGSLANGTDVPDGSYKLRIRALKITGDLARDSDFETWLSPTITIKRS